MASQLITIQDLTSKGTFAAIELERAVWSLRYQALYHYNRSPWVTRGYADSISDVILVPKGHKLPAGSWHIELLDTSDQPGALGYHEDQAHTSSSFSIRGLAAHSETPLSKVFCKTSREDGIEPTEVASHEMLEMIVDPWVINEDEIRKYLDSNTKQWYIGEVGDPAQGRGYDVGAPEQRPCKVPEAVVADFAYPGWWRVDQKRIFTTATEEFGLANRLEPFALAPGGYMSVAPEANPSEWSQIYGEDRKTAEKNSDAYERPGEIG
jgi:hypothetical protein